MSTTSSGPGRNDPCPCGSGKKFKACCQGSQSLASSKSAIEPMLQRAWAAVAARDVEGTMLWFRQVLAVQPNHAVALAGLGQALCWQEQRKEGLGYLREAARQLEKQLGKSRDPQFVLQLAGQLHHWGDLETSIRLVRLAHRLAPNAAVPANNLALYLLRINRAEEALPYAQSACKLAPDNPASENLLAVIESQLGRLPEARARFERIVTQRKDPEQTARAAQELALVLDKQGEYEQAFAATTEAKRLHAALPGFQREDRQLVFTNIARNRAGFDRSLLQRWTADDFADGLPGPIFLLGFLRSGTTLTEQVLGAHPAVMTSDENALIHELIQSLKALTGCGDNIPTGVSALSLEQARSLRSLYWRRVEAEYGPVALQKRFVDKVALNSIDVGFISAIFPDAKILFALRDPRDVCLSCYMQSFKPSPVTINMLEWEGIARQYAAVMDLWLHLRDDLAPAWMELRYEDTVGDFEATFRKVFALVGVEWTDEVTAFHERAKGRYIATPSFAAVSQKLYSSSVARWRHYEAHYEQILPLLEPFLHTFGYA